MDLRTKLVFALVSVSLGSMLLLGLLTYGPARDVWRDSAVQALDALAESKREQIEGVEELWRDRVRLIRSRTQLRNLVDEYGRTHDPSLQGRVGRILSDARMSVPGREIREITVYDEHGDLVATTLGGGTATPPPLDPTEAASVDDDVELLGLVSGGIDQMDVRLSSPLRVGDRAVGTLLVRMGAEEIVEIAVDYHALGMTGETLIGQLDGTGSVRLLHEPRHATGAPVRPSISKLDDPLVRAVQGVDSTFYRNAFDYRNEPVWAATRYLPELDAGLVVKFDASEREAPLRELRWTSIRFAAAVSALAVLLAILVGIRFATPILQLTEVVEKIEGGNYRVRAPVRTEDEIGRLAYLFNRMTDRLLESNRMLRQQIAEHEGDRPPDAD